MESAISHQRRVIIRMKYFEVAKRTQNPIKSLLLEVTSTAGKLPTVQVVTL
jgi:hypothetical protein